MMNDLDPHRVILPAIPENLLGDSSINLGKSMLVLSSRDVSQVGSRYDLKQGFQCLFKNVDM